jgi:chromosome partitioning protein
MAFVVAVAQQKGGAGKSTLAASLAVALAQGWEGAQGSEGRPPARVALIDSDPQRSLERWHAERARQPGERVALGFLAASGWRLSGQLTRLRAEHDAILLDTPPHAETDARLAIRAADLVLMPVQPSAADLWASEATIALAAAEKRPLVAVLNRVPAQGRQRAQALAALAALGVTVLPGGLGNRAGIAHAFALGLAVTETEPRSVAAAELRALAAAVRGYFAGMGAAGRM